MKSFFDEAKQLAGNAGKRKIDGVRTNQNVKLCDKTDIELWQAKQALLTMGADTAVLEAARRIEKEIQYRGIKEMPKEVYTSNLEQSGFGSIAELFAT